MPYAVLSAFFGLMSSLFATVSACRRKQWLSALYRSIFLAASIIGFLAALHASSKKRSSSKQAA